MPQRRTVQQNGEDGAEEQRLPPGHAGAPRLQIMLLEAEPMVPKVVHLNGVH